jgi:(p)ppGpp synthase/HD superfamily hydrolase
MAETYIQFKAADEMNSNLIDKAAGIAVRAHSGQTSKVDGSPYIIHPVMVAARLLKHGFPDTTVAAAFVHDVLEDTDYPAARLRRELGREVARLVRAVSSQELKDWRKKKLRYIASVRRGGIQAMAICAADKIHNLERLLAAHGTMGPEIWSKFTRGREDKAWFEGEVLKMLKADWSHPLIGEYQRLLAKESKLK